jgi:hypothetical protein
MDQSSASDLARAAIHRIDAEDYGSELVTMATLAWDSQEKIRELECRVRELESLVDNEQLTN